MYDSLNAPRDQASGGFFNALYTGTHGWQRIAGYIGACSA